MPAKIPEKYRDVRETSPSFAMLEGTFFHECYVLAHKFYTLQEILDYIPEFLAKKSIEDDTYYFVHESKLVKLAKTIYPVCQQQVDLDRWKLLHVEKLFSKPISDRHSIMGFFDMVVRDEHGNNWIVENKFYNTNVDIIHHLLQVSVYMYARDTVDAEGVIVNRITKTNGAWSRYRTTEINENLFLKEVQQICDRMEELENGLSFPYRNSNPNCRWDCRKYDLCVIYEVDPWSY